jgi:endonuclease YncB( thermonuclease family)
MILALLALVAAGQPFPCHVVAVHDGDTMRCADGTRVRLQGIDANELDGTCHTVCARQTALQARATLTRLALGRTAHCASTGRSYRRVVAWCSVEAGDGSPRDLSCELVARQAAIVWRAYDPRGRLDRCAAVQSPAGAP